MYNYFARNIHFAYVIIVVPFLFFLILFFPFGTFVDEPNHVLRAASILSGDFIAVKNDDGFSGGLVDGNLIRLIQLYGKLVTEDNGRVSAALLQAGNELKWGDQPVMGNFPNTAIYPPFFYLPDALGLWIGQVADLSIEKSILLARLMNALVAVALAATALRLAAGGRVLLFTILLLPMCVAQMASCSQDSLILACSALLAALVSRQIAAARPASGAEFSASAMLILLLSLARPTNLIIVALLALIGWKRAKPVTILVIAVAIITVTLGWILLILFKVQVPLAVDGVMPDMSAQLHNMAHHLGVFPKAIFNTVVTDRQGLFRAAVCMIRWGHMPIHYPDWYFDLAASMLCFATLVTILEPARTDWRACGLILCLVAISFIGLYFVQYLTFTSVGDFMVRGVQGRYFIPLALLVSVVLPSAPAWLRGRVGHSCLTVASILLIVFPAISIAMVQHALITGLYVH